MTRPRRLSTLGVQANPRGPTVEKFKLLSLVQDIVVITLAVVVAVRPLVSETYDSAGTSFAASLPEIREPTPVRTLIFDACLISALVLSCAVRAISGRCYIRAGIEIGLAVLVCAAIASCLGAGNKRLAINGTLDWLCGPVLAIALIQVMTRGWHRTVVLAAIVGSAAAQATQCYDQYFFTYPETVRTYEAGKVAFWAAQGVELDSSKVELFERRMLAREATGFLSHSNVTGSHLATCALVAAGLASTGWRGVRRGTTLSRFVAAVVATAVALWIAVAIVLTGSRGALLSFGLAATGWLAVLVAGRWIASHRRLAFSLGWIAATIGIVGTITAGIIRDSLPGASLQFRWEYWKASAKMIADHPWTGVGRENFGRHYLQYKSISSPEEIANPHNLFVQAAAEWGLLGLVGLVVLIVGWSWRLAASGSLLEKRENIDDGLRDGRAWAPTIFVGVATLATGVGLLGADQPAFRFVFSILAGIPWLIAASAVVGNVGAGDLPQDHRAHWRQGALAGLGAFLVHDLINFALFVPGTATVFFALAAVCVPVGPSSPASRGGHDRRLILACFIGVLGLVTVFSLGLLPVRRATAFLAGLRGEADRIVLRNPDSLDALIRRATEADRLDPNPLMAVAEQAYAAAQADPTNATRHLASATNAATRAASRDPYAIGLRRLQARVLLHTAVHTNDPNDFALAISASRSVVEAYPTDPHGKVTLGDCLLTAAEATGRNDWAADAAIAYQEALRLDDARPDWESIRRLRPRERSEIDTKAQRAAALSHGR